MIPLNPNQSHVYLTRQILFGDTVAVTVGKLLPSTSVASISNDPSAFTS